MAYTTRLREDILTSIALSTSPVFVRAVVPEHYSRHSINTTLMRLVRSGELRRVRIGMYDVGPQAPRWVTLLRHFARAREAARRTSETSHAPEQ